MADRYATICECEGFDPWYFDDEDLPPEPVCQCGHQSGEHLDGYKSCTGIIVVYPDDDAPWPADVIQLREDC